MSEANWYVVHTYSGYENKVKANIDKTIENRHLEDQILEVRVPMQDVVELKNGKKKQVQKKMFPGYVLIHMVMNDDTWYVVRNTRGVTGFVGVGSDPIPMEDEEVKNIFRVIGYSEENSEKEDAELVAVDFAVGDYVIIEAEGFVGQRGKVAEINLENRKVKVMMDMFGRMTPIEANITDVKKEED